MKMVINDKENYNKVKDSISMDNLKNIIKKVFIFGEKGGLLIV